MVIQRVLIIIALVAIPSMQLICAENSNSPSNAAYQMLVEIKDQNIKNCRSYTNSDGTLIAIQTEYRDNTQRVFIYDSRNGTRLSTIDLIANQYYQIILTGNLVVCVNLNQGIYSVLTAVSGISIIKGVCTKQRYIQAQCVDAIMIISDHVNTKIYDIASQKLIKESPNRGLGTINYIITDKYIMLLKFRSIDVYENKGFRYLTSIALPYALGHIKYYINSDELYIQNGISALGYGCAYIMYIDINKLDVRWFAYSASISLFPNAGTRLCITDKYVYYYNVRDGILQIEKESGRVVRQVLYKNEYLTRVVMSFCKFNDYIIAIDDVNDIDGDEYMLISVYDKELKVIAVHKIMKGRNYILVRDNKMVIIGEEIEITEVSGCVMACIKKINNPLYKEEEKYICELISCTKDIMFVLCYKEDVAACVAKIRME